MSFSESKIRISWQLPVLQCSCLSPPSSTYVLYFLSMQHIFIKMSIDKLLPLPISTCCVTFYLCSTCWKVQDIHRQQWAARTHSSLQARSHWGAGGSIRRWRFEGGRSLRGPGDGQGGWRGCGCQGVAAEEWNGRWEVEGGVVRGRVVWADFVPPLPLWSTVLHFGS